MININFQYLFELMRRIWKRIIDKINIFFPIELFVTKDINKILLASIIVPFHYYLNS